MLLFTREIHKSSDTPFRKQLTWHIAEGCRLAENNDLLIHAAVLTFTPDESKEALKRNTTEEYCNRPLSDGTVVKYGKGMARGWRLTGETIIFSRSGWLLNGQHRLEACIKSGQSFTVLCAFGVADDAFAFMDIGKKRTSGDIFSINGVGNANLIAAATLWLWKYEHTGMLSVAAGQSPQPDQLFEYYLQNKDLSESVNHGRKFRKLAFPSLMTALHYLCAQKNRQQANRFFERVGDKVDLVKNSPEWRLQKELSEARDAGNPVALERSGALTVIAWNAVREGRRPAKLYWRKDNPLEAFPRVI